MSKESSENKIIINYCSVCCNENSHSVLFKEHVVQGDEDYRVATDYQTVKCLGCGWISFREDFHDYEQSYPNENNEWEYPITTTLYPPVLKNHRNLEYSWKLPDSIKTVYEESLNALKSECKILAGAGFRAVIEAICLDKAIKGKNLEIRINNLAKEGLITKKECERLHSIRFLGNDSIHEMKVPDSRQLSVVLNIVEHILKNIYLIDLEVDSTLEKPISDYRLFKKLLSTKINMYNIDDEFPLVKFLDKDVRRVKDDFVRFEAELVKEIKNGGYAKLAIGLLQPYRGSTGNVQHYIVKHNSEF